jgi:hypothetical protein
MPAKHQSMAPSIYHSGLELTAVSRIGHSQFCYATAARSHHINCASTIRGPELRRIAAPVISTKWKRRGERSCLLTQPTKDFGQNAARALLGYSLRVSASCPARSF